MKSIKALLWGVALATYLRFGLEPTGWLFYEASFLFRVDGLYWGYSIFRGAAHVLSLWSYQNIFCLVLGSLLSIWKLRQASVSNEIASITHSVAKK
jgi:hypothetical protein